MVDGDTVKVGDVPLSDTSCWLETINELSAAVALLPKMPAAAGAKSAAT
jgi:hypothetical protein